MSGIVASMLDWGLTGFDFEIATTGGNGGDPAIDLLGGQGGSWGEGSTGAWVHYDIPAPGAIALLAMAGLVRRRRS
ncbi:MAG: hypothetical protein H8E91_08040 [Planctomycetes bacterium]|nr:hypothetical protein [Planctomycetota bacterium]